ncbi:hypothetical protein COLO4_31045 [Corchorus olitorius]|uniref:Transposase n=1 Tax=Corchorus olitorius TaxID=93759 RepID=A0A1R3H5W4_9ROSI|nr:hypothetical protein COLO4_31045 [Corchorus olitorius]
MFNQVHIDEKWFFMTRESERYYLLPEEDELVRTCKSKRFITKVMFLAAVARPRFDESGTMETKPMLVTKDVTQAYMIEKILPAIKSKLPDKMETVYIQQDNAKPHINPKDVEFLKAASSDGFDIQISFMKVGGGNNYKVPHMGKDKLQNQGHQHLYGVEDHLE